MDGIDYKSAEIVSLLYDQLISDKGIKTTKWEKESPLTNGAGTSR